MIGPVPNQLVDIPVPGWKAEIVVSDDSTTMNIVAHRESTGPLTDADRWMLENGKAYLDEMLTRTMNSVQVPGGLIRD